ncbi:MAG TPA: hypothetical protein VIO34_06025 [Candidatus Dormibacteraeota bacterium]|jgi:hypothetical protein
MEQVRRIVTPARVRRARAVKAGRFAGALIAIGWAIAFVLGRGNWDQVIAASAFWLVAVLFLLSGWELVMLLTGAPSLGVLPRGKWLARVETWLVPAGLVTGLLFGHYLWS